MVDHEATEREILRLVNEADGPDRAMLLLIYRLHQELIRMNSELTDNTMATQSVAKSAEEHATTLAQHAQDEMALINQIRGGWRVAVGALSIVAVLLGAIQALALRELNTAREQVVVNTGRLYMLERDNEIQREQIQSLRQWHNGAIRQ